MSDHYVHVEISVVGPGDVKIGETVIMQLTEGNYSLSATKDMARYVGVQLARMGFRKPLFNATEGKS